MAAGITNNLIMVSPCTKICSKCKLEKLLTEFSKNKLCKDGLQAWCKLCKQEHMREYIKSDEYKLTRLKYRQSEHGKLIKQEYQHKRRALKKQSGGKFTAEDIKLLMNNQSSKCVYCYTNITDVYHIDHVLPLSKGGTNSPDNLQLLCPTCNLSKGAKLPEIFAMERGLLL